MTLDPISPLCKWWSIPCYKTLVVSVSNHCVWPLLLCVGSGVLVLTTTEVDKTGASYYGEQGLHYLSAKGEGNIVLLGKANPYTVPMICYRLWDGFPLTTVYQYSYWYCSSLSTGLNPLLCVCVYIIPSYLCVCYSLSRIHIHGCLFYFRKERSNLRSGMESKLTRVLCCLWLYPLSLSESYTWSAWFTQGYSDIGGSVLSRV